MLRRIGTFAGLVGTGSGLVGSLWHVLLPTPDANIGAGALVVTGLLLGLGGAAIIVLRVVVGSATSRSAPTSARALASKP